jgi:hypothetical protein
VIFPFIFIIDPNVANEIDLSKSTFRGGYGFVVTIKMSPVMCGLSRWLLDGKEGREWKQKKQQKEWAASRGYMRKGTTG